MDIPPEHLARRFQEKKNMADYGLMFMLQEYAKELVLIPEVIDSVYKTISKIALKQPTPKLDVPELGADADEDAQEAAEVINEKNAQTDKENAKLSKIQQKIRLNVVEEG